MSKPLDLVCELNRLSQQWPQDSRDVDVILAAAREIAGNRADTFRAELLAHCAASRERTACDRVLEFFEERFDAGDFQTPDATLRLFCVEIVLSRISTSVLVAILGVTLPAKEVLSERKHFVMRACEKLAIRCAQDSQDLIAKYA